MAHLCNFQSKFVCLQNLLSDWICNSRAFYIFKRLKRRLVRRHDRDNDRWLSVEEGVNNVFLDGMEYLKYLS